MKDEFIENLDKDLTEYLNRDKTDNNDGSTKEEEMFTDVNLDEDIFEDEEKDDEFRKNFDRMLDDFIAQQIEEYENDFTKDDEEDDKEADKKSCKKENIFPLGYQWIVENIASSTTFRSQDTFDLMKEMTNGNVYEFKNLYLHKYYYRFIKPIEYNHPNYCECEESLWPLLFQLAFAERDDAKIIDRENQLPDIELNYMFERRTIASLSLEEVKSLTLELANSAFYETHLKVCDAIYSAPCFIRDDRPILKEELQLLYGCNHNTKKEDFDFIDTIYNRITRCDVETMPYRLIK